MTIRSAEGVTKRGQALHYSFDLTRTQRAWLATALDMISGPLSAMPVTELFPFIDPKATAILASLKVGCKRGGAGLDGAG
jgi:hypothetical protein